MLSLWPMQRALSSRLVVVVSLFLTTLAAAQSTTVPARAKVVTPSGFVRVEVAGRSYITLPADEAWVRRGAGQVGRQTPTTQASDIAHNLRNKKELLQNELRRDFPTLGADKIDRLLVDLEAPLAEVASIRPAMVYLVTPAEHLKRALREGWSDPRFRYNRAADSIEYTQTVSLQPHGSDESAVAAVFNPADAEAKRVSALARYVADTERQIQQQIVSRAVVVLIDHFERFFLSDALADLPKQEDQDWLAKGLAGVLAAKYASLLHGAPPAEIVQAMLVHPPEGPFNPARVDLVRPLAVDQLKEDRVAPYLAAKRQKAIAVMYVWQTRAGEGQLPVLLEAIPRLRPADGPSLLAAIKSCTGVDLSYEVHPH